MKTKDLNKDQFLENYKIDQRAFEATELDWEMLNSIYKKHSAHLKDLNKIASYVVDCLRDLDEVHSIRYRVKDPEHLIEKIIRKTLGNTLTSINDRNYSSRITDLIGIRALHLFKHDWVAIHEYITSTWEPKRKPEASIREGDSKDLQELYKESGCKVVKHDRGYRSVHYILKTRPTNKITYVELQCRTIIEEAWSEIDHRFFYPYGSQHSVIESYLDLFNRLTGSADAMGTYIKYLVDALTEQTDRYRSVKIEKAEIQKRLRSVISTLDTSDQEKSDLRREVARLTNLLKEQDTTFFGIGGLAGSIPEDSWKLYGVASSTESLLGNAICGMCKKRYEKDYLDIGIYCPNCRERYGTLL